jgi:FtsP/CotA-like multicopper oxidase with cupredoxin domain
MRGLFFLAIAAAILGGLFFLFKPGRLADEAQVAPAPAAPQVPAPRIETPVAASPREVDLVVKGGKLVSGDPVIKLRQGDSLTLRITSDKADEVHLHGYDRHAHIKAGGTATLAIQADRTGRFPFELHKSHLELGTIEVYPRP